MGDAFRRQVLQREVRGEQLTVLRGPNDWQVCLGTSERVGRSVVPLLQEVIGSDSQSLAIMLDALQLQDDADHPLTRDRLTRDRLTPPQREQ
jgi:hypothetical protein